MPFMVESSPHSDQCSEADSVLPGGTPPPPPPALSKSFAKTNSDANGKLSFVPSSTALRDDGNPQDLLLVDHGTIDGETHDILALSWVSRAMGGARTNYYFLDSHGKHRTTAYDKVQKWLPGFWTAQITNGEFDEQKTRAFRILALFHNKESLEEAMSTVFNPINRVTDQEIMGAKYVDDDSAKELIEDSADEKGFDCLFDDSGAESGDDAVGTASHDLSSAGQNKAKIANNPARSQVRQRTFAVVPGSSTRKRSRRAVSESSEEFSLAQQHKRVNVGQTSSTAQIGTLADETGEDSRNSRAEKIARDWGVDIDWLTTSFGDKILQQAYFVTKLGKWIKAHPKIPAQDAFKHFKSRSDKRRSGELGGQGMKRANLWQAVDICLDGEEDEDDATPASRPQLSKTPPSRPQPSKLEKIAKGWGVDVDWLGTSFGDGMLQHGYFISALRKWIEAHPTMPAEDALAHFHRRRNLRRSCKLRQGGPTATNPWTAADIRLCEEDDDDNDASASTTAPTAVDAVSAALRSSTSARASTSSSTPLPVPVRDTASMLAKLASAWPSAMSSVSSLQQNSIATSPPAQPGQMTTTPSVYAQSTMARNTPSTFLQNPIAQTTPTVKIAMTEAEAAGILYSPMATGGLDQFKQVQRAVGVLFGKTPPLHIIQIAVGRLRFSKDPNKCIDEDPGYKAWMDANF